MLWFSWRRLFTLGTEGITNLNASLVEVCTMMWVFSFYYSGREFNSHVSKCATNISSTQLLNKNKCTLTSQEGMQTTTTGCVRGDILNKGRLV